MRDPRNHAAHGLHRDRDAASAGTARAIERERPNLIPRCRLIALALAAAAAAFAAIVAPPARSETILRAVSALPRTVDPTRSFLDNLIGPANRAN